MWPTDESSSPSRRNESPTPSDFIDGHAFTPSISRQGSLSPGQREALVQHALRSSMTVTHGQQEQAHSRQPSAEDLDGAAAAAARPSGSLVQLASPERLGRHSDSEASMMRDMEWRAADGQMQQQHEEEEEESVINHSASADLHAEVSFNEDDAPEHIAIDDDEEVDNGLDATVIATEPAETESASTPPRAAAAATSAEEEPRQFVMHLFGSEAANLASPLRQRLQFTDAAATMTSPSAAAPAVDVDALLASDDDEAVRAALRLLAGEKARLAKALAIEKNVTNLLDAQARAAENRAADVAAKLAAEIARANAAVRAAEDATALQPMIVGRDGLPLALAAPQLMSEATPAAPAAAALQDASMQTDAETKPAAAAADPGLASPSRHFVVSKGNAARNLLRKHLHEPVVRAGQAHRAAAADVRALLRDFSAEMAEGCASIGGAVAALQREGPAGGGDWYARYQAEKRQRQKLHNTLLELQGNIRVFARVRPLLANQAANASGGENAQAAAAAAVDSNSSDATAPAEQDATRIIDGQTLAHAGKVYEFDRVLDQSSTQAQVYESVAPFIQSVADGYSVAVFAYGQTGSGKTHSMEGSATDPGVNIRALEHLFSLLAARSSSPDETGAQRYSATVRMSALEIYNETPRDLLVDPREYRKSLGAAADSVAATNAKLEVHQHPDGSIFVPGLTERPVSCVADITALVASHVRPNRATAATAMNEYSSRSHSIIFIKVETSSSPAGEGEVERTHGRLVLIDLAGSERVKKSEAQGQALKEASHINKSLSALGDVISALRNKAPHIPFRNSKLTYLLSDCLGGSSKVLLFAQLSPSTLDASESACTLQFASRARNVQLGRAQAKRSRSQSAVVLAKLAKVEAALAEAQTAAERSQAELKTLREESAAERASAAARLADVQGRAAERAKALEAEFATKRALFSIPIIPPAAVAAPAAVATAPVAPAAAASASAGADRSTELKHLQALLRAKDREILELKLQRSHPAVSSVAVTAAAAAAATLPPASSPAVSAVTSRALPQIHSFAGITSPSGAVTRQQTRGVNLLDAAATAAAAAGEIAPLVLVFDDEAPVGQGEGGLAEAADPMEEAAGPVTRASKRASLTGHKRKESPGKSSAASDVAENEDAGADENAPQLAASAAPVHKSALSKKARVLPPQSTTAAPATPAKLSAAPVATAVLGSSTAALNVRPGSRSGAAKSTMFAAATGALQKTPLRAAAQKRLQAQQAWATTAKVAPAAVPVPATPVTAAADAEMDVEDYNSTPVPSASGGKQVRFGGAQTKFISPVGREPSAAHAHGTLPPPLLPHVALASSTASIESLRVKNRSLGRSAAGSSLGGGAKRLAVKPSGWRTY